MMRSSTMTNDYLQIVVLWSGRIPSLIFQRWWKKRKTAAGTLLAVLTLPQQRRLVVVLPPPPPMLPPTRRPMGGTRRVLPRVGNIPPRHWRRIHWGRRLGRSW
jgi:hypothetical protein